MRLRERVIYDISNEIFKNNLCLNEGCELYLSHIVDDLFCIFTDKPMGSIFGSNCSEKLNPFFENLGDMLLSNDLTGKGCFDYENIQKDRFSSPKNKINNYLNDNLSFILIRYSFDKIKPLSFFTLSSGYIWTVCTDHSERGNGFMSKLFKHFLKILKRGELKKYNNINFSNDSLSLNLLKKNPAFDKTKLFYEECGFKLKEDRYDMIIMETLL